MKISEWLNESIGSHDIADSAALRADFVAKVGHEPINWPSHSKRETKRAIDARGLGGSVREGEGDDVWGYELAAKLAFNYADGFRPTAIGRGTAFWQCVEALQKAGK